MKRNIEIHMNERGYPYLEWRCGCHSKQPIRVWVNRGLIEDGQRYIAFPIQDAEIITTEKGSLVLRPTKNKLTYLVSVSSGYRGSASIDSIEGGAIVASGSVYHSPLGSLGQTSIALVCNDGAPIHIKGRISGRRVTKPTVDFILYPDGSKFDADELEVEKYL